MASEDSGRSFAATVADFLDSIGLEELTEDYREEHREAEAALAAAFDPLPDALAAVPEVHEVNKVNTHDDGGDVLVPVVPVMFEDAGEPDRDVVWETVGAVLRAVHPMFGEHERAHVRHYDVQFAYADEDESEVIYRRVTIHPPPVESLLADPGYRLADLRADVAAGDDGDDGVPPVNFKPFDAESLAASGAYAGGGGAAIAATCAASSSGAAASCAGTAAGAGGGAGGGAC
jgi:hypothetical protein